MKKFLDFIDETYAASLVYKENIDEKINVCLGNVSCDMDSSIGVYVLSYYLTHLNSYFDDSGNYENLHIPVINCPRGELSARIDIAHHLEKHGIDLKKLVYITDLDLDYYSNNNLLNLSIIDHNKLDITQEKWYDSVRMIVDHHVDTHSYDNKNEVDKIVTFCGSACSMAFNKYYDSKLNYLLDKEICDFFSPAILLDTENLKSSLKDTKWGDIDQLACHRMFKIMMEDSYQSLIKKKTDKQLNLDLGLDLILKKDYKNYTWKNIVAGISVAFNTFHDIINTFTLEYLKTLIQERITSKGLHLYMIITQTYGKDGKALREFMIYDEDSVRFHKLKKAFEANCPFKLKLKKFTGLSNNNFCFWIILDDSVSRKKVEPIFKKIFEESLI